MSTQYSKIYENVLPKMQSYEIPMMSTEEIEEMLSEYITPAVSKFHVCKKNLYDRDEKCFNCDLTSLEIDILGNFLLLEYLDSNYIRVPTVLKTNLSSSDFNAFSNANLLDKLLDMHDKYLSENEALISRYAWTSYDNYQEKDSISKLKSQTSINK